MPRCSPSNFSRCHFLKQSVYHYSSAAIAAQKNQATPDTFEIAARIRQLYRLGITESDKRAIAKEITETCSMIQEAEIFSYLRRDCPEAQRDFFGDEFDAGTDDEPKSSIIIQMPGDQNLLY